jgi:magnesium transporter
MLHAFLCDQGGRCVECCTLEALGEALSAPPKVVWLDLEAASEEELDFIQSRFQLHPLTIEDCRTRDTRPKLEEYDRYLFIVLRGLRYEEEARARGQVATIELEIFLGGDFLITCHAEALSAIKTTQERLRQSAIPLERGGDMVAHAIIDSLLDNYLPYLDQLDERLETVEERLFANPSDALLSETFAIRKELVELIRLMRPQRELLGFLSSREHPHVSEAAREYFRDVHDHALHISDALESYRELLTSARETYLSLISNRLNSIMKVLSIVATVILPLSLLASMWGMNFALLPGARSPTGFWVFTGVCLLLAALMMWAFKRKGWW